MTNAVGCDSVVTLDLTINTVGTSVAGSGSTLTANATGASYQWLDCNNGYTPITGETNQSFTATSNGDYAVAVTKNDCSDTSYCHKVNITDITSGKDRKGELRVYPNPTSGDLTLEFVGKDPEFRNTEVTMINMVGKIVYREP